MEGTDEAASEAETPAGSDDDVNVEEGNTKQSEALNGGTKRTRKELTEEELEAKRERRRQYQAEVSRSRDLLVQRNMDALIVAVKSHPTPIVCSLLDLLAPSRPFAVHCPYKEVSQLLTHVL